MEDFIQFFLAGYAQSLPKNNINTNFHEIGKSLAPKLLEIYEIHQTNDLDHLLKKIKSMLSTFYSSKRELIQMKDFFLLEEYEPFFNKSGCKNPNLSMIIAGIIEGCLRINFFDCQVTIADASNEKYPLKLFYVIRRKKKNVE